MTKRTRSKIRFRMTILKHPVTLKCRKSPLKSRLHSQYFSRISRFRRAMMTAKSQKERKTKMKTTMRTISSYMRTRQRNLAVKTPSKSSSSCSKIPPIRRGSKTLPETTKTKNANTISLVVIKRSVWRSHQASKEIKSSNKSWPLALKPGISQQL